MIICTELMGTPDSELKIGTLNLSDNYRKYLPPSEILCLYSQSGPLEDRMRDEYFRQKFPGFDFSLKRTESGFHIAPPWHPVNLSSYFNPGLHYAHIAFEGSSVVPVVDDNGELIGANLVLHEQRMRRFKRSIDSIGMGSTVSEQTLQQFSDGVADLASILARRVLTYNEGSVINNKGETLRGYVRPWAIRVCGTGVSPLDTDYLDMGVGIASMGRYLPEEAFRDGAVAGAFVDFKRDAKILGKVAGNYTHAGDIGKEARRLGLHEAALWAPYWIDPETLEIQALDPTEPEIADEQLLKGGLPADGPGEDIVFFDKEGTLLYQPMNTNILGGTTREYIIKHLAPEMEIDTREFPVTVDDIRKGDIVGMAYTGNAVTFCPVREFGIYDAAGEMICKFDFDIPLEAELIKEVYSHELSGRVKTAGPLLTPVDLCEGDSTYNKLKGTYKGWF